VSDLMDAADEMQSASGGQGERLLIVTPRAPLVSQAWLYSHAAALGDSVVATATYEPLAESWVPGRSNVELGPAWALGNYGLGKLFRLSSRTRNAEIDEISPTAAVVHTATLFDLVAVGGGPLDGLPIVVYVHGADITWSPFRRFPTCYKHFGNTAAYRQRLIRASKDCVFIANSQFSAERMIDAGIPDERIRVCYLPVPSGDCPVQEKTSTELSLLYLGRFVGFKGPLNVVRSVAKAKNDGASVRLKMIGDGPLFNEVAALVESEGLGEFITLEGAMAHDQAMAELEKSDALILHNRVDPKNGQLEAFGYAHAEALVRGKPVLTGAAGGQTDFLSSGTNALLVQPEDVESQAAQIKELASDPRMLLELSRGAVRTATELFSADSHRKNMIEAINWSRV